MKKTLLILTTLFLFTLQYSFAQFSPDFSEYLEARMVQDESPSFSIAVLYEHGKVYFFSIGTKDFDSNYEVNEHTIYEIGSITKTFTAGILHHLLSENGFSTSTPVNEIISEFANIRDYEERHIKVGDLLNHHSALPRLPGNMMPANDMDPYQDYTNSLMYNFLDDFRPLYKPGTQFAYSNLGYMLAGNIAEILSGNSIDNLYEYYFTAPLEMNSTSRILADSSRFAQPTFGGERVLPWNFDGVKGLGELRSTTADLISYVKMMSGKTDIPYRDYFIQATTDRKSISESVSMAHGWFVMNQNDDVIVYHGGGTGGFRAFAGFSEVSGRAAVVLTNSGAEVDDIGLHLINDAFELKELSDYITLSNEQMERLTGVFENDMLPDFTIFVENDRLLGQLEGQGPLPLFAITETEFENESVRARVNFELEDDKATSFTLLQGGQSFVFTLVDENREVTEREVIEMSSEDLQAYTGSFTWEGGLQLNLRVDDNQLMAQLTAQPFIPVYPESESVFFYKAAPAELHFERNEQGVFHRVVLHQAGQQLIFNRIE